MPKFKTIPLTSFVNASLSDSQFWQSKTAKSASELPIGSQVFWGIPFDFSVGKNNIVVFSDRTGIEIPLNQSGSHLVFAHFCDEKATTTVAGQSSDYLNPVVTAPGEHLADYTLSFEDGSQHRQRIRAAFALQIENSTAHDLLRGGLILL